MPTLRKIIQALLLTLERAFRVDIRYLIKGTLWMNFNRGISTLCGIALSVAFAHFLTKETYGTYTFVLGVIGLFSMPLTSGLGAGIAKGVARGHHSIVFKGLRLAFPWSLAAGIMLSGLGIYYFVAGNTLLAICFILGGFTLPLSVSNGIAKSFLSSKGDYELLTRFNVVRTPLVTILLISIAWISSSALFIVVANILINTILGYLLYRDTRKKYSFTEDTVSTEAFASRYGLHSAFLSIFTYISEQIDDFLLWKFAGAAPIAMYTYAVAPVREIRSLVESQSILALPKFAQKTFSQVQSNLGFRIRQLYLVALPLTLLYILAAPLIFKILFPQYVSIVHLSQLAALSLLSAPRRLMQVAISAHNRVKESYIMIIIPQVTRIILAIILIPLYGILGAVVALLISEVIDYLVLGIMIQRLKHTQ